MYQFDCFSGFGQELQAGRTKSMQAPKLKLLHWAAVSRVEASTLRHSPTNHLDSAHEEAPWVYQFLAGTAAGYSQDTVAHILVLAFYNPCRLDIFCFSFFLHFQANCASKSNGGGGQDRDFSSASSPTNKTVEFRSGAIWFKAAKLFYLGFLNLEHPRSESSSKLCLHMANITKSHCHIALHPVISVPLIFFLTPPTPLSTCDRWNSSNPCGMCSTPQESKQHTSPAQQPNYLSCTRCRCLLCSKFRAPSNSFKASQPSEIWQVIQLLAKYHYVPRRGINLQSEVAPVLSSTHFFEFARNSSAIQKVATTAR